MRGNKTSTAARVFSVAALLSTLLVAMVAAAPASAVEPNEFKAIASGDDHQCFLEGGQVYCAGDNSAGQSGQDRRDANNVLAYTKVPGLSGVQSITAGERHTCALMGNGTARCWGKNNEGQLGNGTKTDSFMPVTVSGIDNFTYLNAGDRHTCGVRGNGSIVCWGDNQYGTLGNGTRGDATTPSTVTGILNAATVSGGQTHTCAVLTNGNVRCWGRNNRGQLGDGANPFVDRLTPVFVTNLNNVSSVSAGWAHTCAVATDGRVRCWGWNESGQVDGSPSDTSRNSPKLVSGVSNAVQVAAGFRYSCAVTSAGKSVCWGDNTGGQIGNGQHGAGSDLDLQGFYTHTLTNVTAIGTGDQHTCVRSAAGMYCWGDNNDGQMGNGNTTDVFTPTGISIGGSQPPPPPPTVRSIEELVAQPDFTVADADTLRLYNAFFLREPDLGGALYWIGLTRAGNDLSVLALQFALSEEFQNTYGTLNNAQYVEQIYTNVLGRDFDQGGYEYWLGLLNNGSLDRGGVVRWIAANDEFKDANLYGGK